MTVQLTLAKGVAAVAAVAAIAAVVFLKPAHSVVQAVEAKVAPQPPGQITFAANAAQLSSLKVVAVTAIPLPVSDLVSARVTYDEGLTARISAPIAGRVIALHAEPGDQVRRGFILAAIDAPDLATADADWRKAQADEVRKRLAQTRAQTLFDGEVLARKDLEAADADHAQAKAETRRAALRMKNLNATGQEQGAYGLRSPIDGMVVERQINPGQEIRPDLANPLFVVTDLRHLWVIADVAERSANALRAGQQVTLETDAYPGERFTARIERVGLALDPGTRRVQVRCSVANLDLKLKPEMFARVSFLPVEGAAKAVAVTNSGLFVEGMYDFVFVETRPNTFVKRRVNVALRGHETSFIDAGLVNGERVVTEGAFLLNAEVAANAQ